MRFLSRREAEARPLAALILVGVGVLGLALTAFAIPRVGIGVDAAVHALTSIELRDLPANLTLTQAYEHVFGVSEFYGVFMQQFADWLHSTFEDTGYRYLQPDWLPTYRWQALGTLTLGALTAACLGWTVLRSTGSRVAGAFAFAAVMTTPPLHRFGDRWVHRRVRCVRADAGQLRFNLAPVARGQPMVHAHGMASRHCG